MARKSTTKKPRTRTKANAPGAAAAVPGHNSDAAAGGDDDAPVELSSDDMQALFFQHRTKWNEYKAKQAVVDQFYDDMTGALKNDGFTIKQMKIADDLMDVAGEAKVKAEVKDRLQVATWMGHPLGAQLDMFDQPDDTPLVDRAYAAGRRQSMQNLPLQPPHSPETEAYRAYCAGYHDHQRELAGGIRAPADVNQSTMAHADEG